VLSRPPPPSRHPVVTCPPLLIQATLRIPPPPAQPEREDALRRGDRTGKRSKTTRHTAPCTPCIRQGVTGHCPHTACRTRKWPVHAQSFYPQGALNPDKPAEMEVNIRAKSATVQGKGKLKSVAIKCLKRAQHCLHAGREVPATSQKSNTGYFRVRHPVQSLGSKHSPCSLPLSLRQSTVHILRHTATCFFCVTNVPALHNCWTRCTKQM
jgi:hypothetical protein